MEYYAVLEGRVDEPTIFSSWGDAHPRVTGCRSVHRGFYTIEKARDYLEKNGAAKHKEVIKIGAGETAPVKKTEAFYAVAHGKNLGITPYCGDSGSKLSVDQVSGACYEHFRTRAQAEDFIDDWKQTVANLYWEAITKALDQGYRPVNMELSLGGWLCQGQFESGVNKDSLGDLAFGVLKLE